MTWSFINTHLPDLRCFICKQNFYLNVIIRMTIGLPGDVHDLVDSSLATANHEPGAQQKRANASLIM